jgi:hypothetical protein
MSDKKRKTRLKGTETRKPCFGCGKTKDRLKDFKPRWAGCINHRTDRGRRFFKAGCADCEAIVNGNIRQPRCIGCDKARPKKRNDAPTPTVETPKAIESLAALATDEPAAPPLNLPESVVEGKSEAVREVAEAAGVAVIEAPVIETKPEDLLGLPEKVETPAPVVITTPEPTVAPAPEAVVVNVPPPVVTPPSIPTPVRKKVANKADLFALFSGDDEPSQPTEETKPPF